MPTLPKKQLLLLNTNTQRLALLGELLVTGTQFNILIASSTREAINILKNEAIDFVVSNINLDNFDGWRLARMVRSGVLKCSADTPFVVVANTWCEHIASATAREFGINRAAVSGTHLCLCACLCACVYVYVCVCGCADPPVCQ